MVLGINATCRTETYSLGFQEDFGFEALLNSVLNPQCEFICKSVAKYRLRKTQSGCREDWLCLVRIHVLGVVSYTSGGSMCLVLRPEKELEFPGALDGEWSPYGPTQLRRLQCVH